MKKITIYLFLFVVSIGCNDRLAFGQEQVVPLSFNGALIKPVGSTTKTIPSVNKTTALTLPFFDDFTSYSPYTDDAVWEDREVYINNTMCVSPVSRGVATFDGLNAAGLPYDQNISSALVYADSLTSKAFDLSASVPADSIYFSFFYQPQGNGFYPETQDSLMLYFKKSNGAWVKMWSKQGSTLDSFKQVMVPLADTVFMHANFQFRFVNKASLNTNDDVWNVDYIRFAANRNQNDTLIEDVAFTINPTYILNDLTYMPYRQFLADPNKERATQHSVVLKNNNSALKNVNYGYTVREKFNNIPMFSSAVSSTTLNALFPTSLSLPMYTNTVMSTNYYDNFNFENKYYIQSLGGNDRTVNDTIVREQVFHNYMAYDDGTAEKSYYLHLFPTLPGKTAIEYHLNRPDTIKGISIYFGRQVPLAYAKYFSVAVYKSIATSGSGSDQLVYQEDYLIPAYQHNDFEWTYKFSTPVPMDAGTFYIGTIQPALSNSDSLYIGLDVNRVGGNHLYYNVVGYWQPTTVTGALMIRPILGQIIASGINDRLPVVTHVSVSPNPSADKVQVYFGSKEPTLYTLTDIRGGIVNEGVLMDEGSIDIRNLPAGVYVLKLNNHVNNYQPQKIIKY